MFSMCVSFWIPRRCPVAVEFIFFLLIVNIVEVGWIKTKTKKSWSEENIERMRGNEKSVIRFGHGKVNWTTNKHKASISHTPLIYTDTIWNETVGFDNKLYRLAKCIRSNSYCVHCLTWVFSSVRPWKWNRRWNARKRVEIRVSLKHNITLNDWI